eukprot:m51a1_g4755 hypothetical protein (646) ;mRNA; r:424597-426958
MTVATMSRAATALRRLPPDAEPVLPDSLIERVFAAKNADLNMVTSGSGDERRMSRFLEIMRANCFPPSFHVPDMGIGPRSVGVIAKYLRGDRDLFYALDLSGNPIGDAGSLALASMLEDNGALCSLDLRGCEIGPQGAADIFEALKKNRYVTSVDLSGIMGNTRNRLGGALAAAQAATANPVLARIYAREAGFSAEGLKAFCGGLASSSLAVIDLSANGLGEEAAGLLAGSLSGPSLETLVLAHNNIDAVAAGHVANIMTSCPRLTRLDLSDNRIGKSGSRKIAMAAREHKTLAMLQLDRNSILSVGLVSIAALLGDKTTARVPIAHLSLSGNGLEPSSGNLIASLMQKLPTLKHLDVSDNPIGDEGVVALCGGLSSNATMTSLSLKGLKLSNEGAKSIAEALKHNHTLQVLDLSDNKIRVEGGEALANALDVNTTLQSLSSEYNDFGYHNFTLIKERLLENRKRFNGSTIERVRLEITDLMTQQVKLDELERHVAEVRAAAKTAQERLDKAQKTLRQLDEDRDSERKRIEAAIQERSQAAMQYANQSIALSNEIGRVKTDKDTVFRSVLQKVHREKDASTKAQRRLQKIQHEMQELQESTGKEYLQLEASLRLQQSDKEAVQKSIEDLTKQIEMLRGTAPPSVN